MAPAIGEFVDLPLVVFGDFRVLGTGACRRLRQLEGILCFADDPVRFLLVLVFAFCRQ